MTTATEQEIDTTPEIHLTPEIHFNRHGIAAKVITYCNVNNYMRAKSTYELSAEGYKETHFDEHHKICQPGTVVPRSRLETLDRNNPKSISLLTILGADLPAVEAHLRERGISVHLLPN